MSIRPAPPIRPALPLLLLLPPLLLALASLGCENDGVHTQIGPSSVSSSDAPYVSWAVTVEPPVVIVQPVPAAACPAATPFVAPVNLVLRGDGVTDLSLSRVHMQFMDRTGAAGGSTVFTATELTSRFGSTLIPVFGTRTFPLVFPFGCVGQPFGTLTVVAFVVDGSGRERRSSVNVALSVL